MSALLPHHRLYRQSFADLNTPARTGLAPVPFRAMVRCAVRKPYPTTQAAHHFRTPSPRGQPDLTPRLSTSFMWHKYLIQRAFAVLSTDRELPCTHAVSMSCVEAVKSPENRGSRQCKPNHGQRSVPVLCCLPHAVIPRRNKPLLVPVRAQLRPLFSMAVRSRVPSSARQATCSTVRPTRASVTDPRAAPMRARMAPVGTVSILDHTKPAYALSYAGLPVLHARRIRARKAKKGTVTCSKKS